MRIVASSLVAVCVTALSAESGATELVIGVISPTGDGRQIGREHDATITFALEDIGVITGGGVTVPLRAELRSDGGDAANAVAAARELAALGAVAILGPVDSKSAKAVMEAGLEIPVLSATATAAELRDPWFFRMTLSDEERIRQYANTLRDRNLAPEPRLVVFDDTTPYGSGLKQALVRELGIPEESAIGWTSFLEPGGVSNENRNLVGAGKKFSAHGLEALDATPNTIIVLGSSLNAVPIAQGIDAVLRERGVEDGKRRFLFVGDDATLRDGAPAGSITVGEPTIVDARDTDLARVQAAYAKRSRLERDTLVVTAYEAAHFVLPRALEAVVKEVGASSGNASAGLSPERIRPALRDQLRSLQFASLEPWRVIRIKNGEIEGAPSVPVYAIHRSLRVLEVFEPETYLKVPLAALDQPTGFLQGPVRIRMSVRGELDRDAKVRYYTRDPMRSKPASVRRDGDELEVSFYPLMPGTYHLDAAPVKLSPPVPEIEVALDFAYPLALIGAVLGSLFFALAVTEKGGAFPRRRFMLGVFTGLLVAVVDLHRDLLPPAVVAAMPSFGSTPNLSALFDGLAGGWIGPGIFLLVIGRLWPGSDTGSHGSKPSGPDEEPKPRDVAAIAGVPGHT